MAKASRNDRPAAARLRSWIQRRATEELSLEERWELQSLSVDAVTEAEGEDVGILLAKEALFEVIAVPAVLRAHLRLQEGPVPRGKVQLWERLIGQLESAEKELDAAHGNGPIAGIEGTWEQMKRVVLELKREAEEVLTKVEVDEEKDWSLSDESRMDEAELAGLRESRRSYSDPSSLRESLVRGSFIRSEVVKVHFGKIDNRLVAEELQRAIEELDGEARRLG